MAVVFSSNTYTYTVGPTETISSTFDISTAVDYSVFVKFAGALSAHIILYVSPDGTNSVADRAIDLTTGSTSIMAQKFFAKSVYIGFYGASGILTVTFMKQT